MGALTHHLDFLVLTLGALLVLGSMIFLLRRTKQAGWVGRVGLYVIVPVLVFGFFSVRRAEQSQRHNLISLVEGLAPTYAGELRQLGHGGIMLDTAADDPRLLGIIEAQKRWLKANKGVADVYTVRLIDNQIVLICDSETDYNHDGVFDSDREGRTDIGEVLESDSGGIIDAVRSAMGGRSVFESEPATDRWGTWVTGWEPIRGDGGQVEAVVGVDFPAEQWVVALRDARLGQIAQIASVLAVLLGGVLAFGFNRANMALREQAARARADRLTSDLQIARGIQMRLMPTEPPAIFGYDIAAFCEPAEETGGDYYDWLKRDDGTVLVSLADVTGHGIGPALVTAVCRAFTRAMTMTVGDLGVLLERLNAQLFDDLDPGRFVTFVGVLIDPDRHTAAVLSAGHAPVLIYRADGGVIESRDADGPALGLIGEGLDLHHPSEPESLAHGDAIVLVSDGFFEWLNPANEMFGVERLQEAITEGMPLGAEGMIGLLRERVEAFAGGTAQPDDMTAVVIRRV